MEGTGDPGRRVYVWHGCGGSPNRAPFDRADDPTDRGRSAREGRGLAVTRRCSPAWARCRCHVRRWKRQADWRSISRRCSPTWLRRGKFQTLADRSISVHYHHCRSIRWAYRSRLECVASCASESPPAGLLPPASVRDAPTGHWLLHHRLPDTSCAAIRALLEVADAEDFCSC